MTNQDEEAGSRADLESEARSFAENFQAKDEASGEEMPCSSFS